ncbi:SDR family NAD(P)-dependent oxidoreductase [Paraburkholderia sp. BR14374]|uniref:SDR family NAD(P)-dependent oxidoreductase n=1 Tax=Paraburkholderia sp. BR14374 TaxID=3237007 RepID=UPI0034D00D36
MSTPLQDKVAIVTGATSGIGRAAALLFASQGMKVVASGTRESTGAMLVAEIAAAGGDTIFVPANVSDATQVERLVKRAEEAYGGVDYAFNNAGVEGEFGPLDELSETAWDWVMDVNLKGVWLAMKYQLPALRRRGGGAIVNTSTNLVALGLPATGIYTASKAAVDALTRVAAMEAGPQGIRVNAVNPGNVETPMTKRLFDESTVTGIRAANPLRKIASADDVAQAALWLLSPASGHVTGQTLNIDGGLTLI